MDARNVPVTDPVAGNAVTHSVPALSLLDEPTVQNGGETLRSVHLEHSAGSTSSQAAVRSWVEPGRTGRPAAGSLSRHACAGSATSPSPNTTARSAPATARTTCGRWAVAPVHPQDAQRHPWSGGGSGGARCPVTGRGPGNAARAAHLP